MSSSDFLLYVLGTIQMLLDDGLGALDQLLELVRLGGVVRLAGQIEDGLVNGDFLIDVGAVEHRALRGRPKRRHLALAGGLTGLGRSLRGDAELLGQSESLHPEGMMLSHHHLGKGLHIRIGSLTNGKGSAALSPLFASSSRATMFASLRVLFSGEDLVGIGGHSCCCGIAGSGGSSAQYQRYWFGFTRRCREGAEPGCSQHCVAGAPC